MRCTKPVMILFLTLLFAPGVRAQAPDAATLGELPEGLRIRTNGPGVRDVGGLSLTDVLVGGLGTLLVRPPAEGVVVEATRESLRFAESPRSQPVAVPWAGVDYVDAYRGRSVGTGTVQGIGLGALTGLVGWGVIELIFMAADNPWWTTRRSSSASARQRGRSWGPPPWAIAGSVSTPREAGGRDVPPEAERAIGGRGTCPGVGQDDWLVPLRRALTPAVAPSR